MESTQAVIATVLVTTSVILHLTEKKEIKKRRCWTRKWLKKRNDGIGRGVLAMLDNELREEDRASYRNFLRMDEIMFNNLLTKIERKIARKDTNMREAIPARKRLAVTLRFLATGETFKSLSFSTRIAHNTLSKIVPEVLKAVISELHPEHMKVPSTEQEWKKVAEDFYREWNFPNCFGSMDGKHILFRPSRSSGSFYRNYKGGDSIVLLALVDANYKFMCIDVGRNGRMSDGGVFRLSNLWKAISNNGLNLPPPEPLPGRQCSIPYVLVADDAFPLHVHIMKPYRNKGLSQSQKIFNYRLSRARRVVENAFGILANRFRVLLTPINLSVEKVELITIASCVLHNYILSCSTESCIMETECEGQPEGDAMASMSRQCGNRPTQQALAIRSEFENFFMTNGTVPWQQDSVSKQNY